MIVTGFVIVIIIGRRFFFFFFFFFATRIALYTNARAHADIHRLDTNTDMTDITHRVQRIIGKRWRRRVTLYKQNSLIHGLVKNQIYNLIKKNILHSGRQLYGKPKRCQFEACRGRRKKQEMEETTKKMVGSQSNSNESGARGKR